MRTLKKSLALVLALVMVFSLAITASADFTDAEEIAYPDEVELLVALGIIEGYEDGSFGPQKTLTRAEAAVIVARLNAFFDKSATTTTYTDMEGYNWANWAVAFAENAGIVNGTGAGKFEPATKLTGYMWVKMLLVSMGYDAEENGMTGSAWQIGVAKLDKTVGISGGHFDLSKEISREEACLFAYNALLATRDGEKFAVEHYTDEKGLHLHYFATETEAVDFAIAVVGDLIGLDIFDIVNYTDLIHMGDYVTSLGFEKHGLRGYTWAQDAWGHPYYGWFALDYATGAYTALTKDWLEPSVVLTEEVTNAELFAAAIEAGFVAAEDYYTTEDWFCLDEVDMNGYFYYDDEPDEYGNYEYMYTAKKNNNLCVPFTGNGTYTYLYNVGGYYLAVVIEQFIGQVVEDQPAVDSTGADAYIVIKNLCDNDDTDFAGYSYYNYHTIYNYDADLGDYVLFNLYQDEPCNIHTPNTVSGTVTGVEMQNTEKEECDDVYTISGAEYLLSKHEGVSVEGGQTAVWYVDDCGNLMLKAADVKVNYQIGFLLSYDAQNEWNGDKNHTCETYAASETFVIYDIATGETKTYEGVVTVKNGATTFTSGATVQNTSATAADALDLAVEADDIAKYNADNAAGLSTGLVIYYVGADGKISYISDTESADKSLQVVTTTNWKLSVDVNDNKLEYVDGEAVTATGYTMNDATEYVYACLETAHKITDAATGLKNANQTVTGKTVSALVAVGEYVYDATGKVVAVAQYQPTPKAEEADPTVEDVLVYVGDGFSMTESENWTVNELGVKKYVGKQWTITGLYVDGEAWGPVVVKEDPTTTESEKPVELMAGFLFAGKLTTYADGKVELKILTPAVDYISIVSAEYEVVELITGAAGEAVVLKDGTMLNLAAGANIICIDDADKSVDAVNASVTEIDISWLKMVIDYYVVDAKTGLVTDIYYCLSNDLND